MTRLIETADGFVEDALEGFARVHADTVRRVDGGVVRMRPLPPGHVAVVVGGGSGHYPAFAGLVGEGLAAGAVCGNIFSSPSAGQAERVAEAAHAGGGVLFSYGNYAGDVLQFGEAERRLNAAGIETRTVLVTDDVASAPVADATLRRGIAGDLCVFRIAGAAAEEGATLDEVERLARHANDRTRTLGVAFGGCTLPGGTEPLFTVPPGIMSVGLGIHGEPGIRDLPLASARELAGILAGPLLEERPAGAGDRVVLIVNGLGAVKYEELFVLFRYLSDELAAAGLTIVQPECGELVTSLDMAGVSATLLWLDEELERLWSSPAATPAYRKGTVVPATASASLPVPAPAHSSGDSPRARPASPAGEPAPPVAPAAQRAGALAIELLAAAHDTIAAHADELGRLDAIAGDGDHGIGMTRGLGAALDAARTVGAEAGVARVLSVAGDAWSEHAGGTSGALWGAGLEALGERIGAALGERDEYSANAVAGSVAAGVARIRQLGGAAPGDKTMVDALVPYAETLAARVAEQNSLPSALADAAEAAQTAAESTARLVPRLGRARPLAERSVGHPDPGAISFALIATVIAAVAQKEADR